MIYYEVELAVIGLSPTDDASIQNVIFTFFGDSWPRSNTPIISNFVIRLDTEIAEFGEYAWQDYASYPNFDPDTQLPAPLQSNLRTIIDGRSESIPEPTTLALMCLGLASIGYRQRKAK